MGRSTSSTDPIKLMQLGKKLLAKLIEYHHTQSELAEKSDLPRQVVNEMIHGNSSRLNVQNFVSLLKGFIRLHIFKTEMEVSYWLRQFCQARGINLIQSIDDLGDRGRELLNLLEEEEDKQKLDKPLTTIQGIPFIGREGIIQKIYTNLRTKRLLTLTGLPGVGKTELARQVRLYAQERHFFSSVQEVPLERETDTEHAIEVIKDAFEKRNLSGKTLYILDNIEQLDGIVDKLEKLLEKKEEYSFIYVLATSRTGLRPGDEEIEPLQSPSLTENESLDTLLTYPAIQLFLERANLGRKNPLALDEITAPLLIDLCNGLDGLPLGILLASSWIGKFTLQTLHQELISKELYTKRTTVKPDVERHKSLNELIAWSYRLLSETEKKIFRRMAIFQDLCSFDEIAVICNLEDLPENDEDLEECLSTLSNHHLITFKDERLGITHATIRNFAERKLLPPKKKAKEQEAIQPGEEEYGKEAEQVTLLYLNYYYYLVTDIIQRAKEKQLTEQRRMRSKEPAWLGLFITQEQEDSLKLCKEHIQAVYDAMLFIRYNFIMYDIIWQIGEEAYDEARELWEKSARNFYIEVQYAGDQAIGGEIVYNDYASTKTKETEEELKLLVAYQVAYEIAAKASSKMFPFMNEAPYGVMTQFGIYLNLDLYNFTSGNVTLHGIMQETIPQAIEHEVFFQGSPDEPENTKDTLVYLQPEG